MAAGSYVPSILLVSAVLAVGGVLALAYRGDRQHAKYSKLQDGQAVQGEGDKDRSSPAALDGVQQQQQDWQEEYLQRRKQQQREQKREQRQKQREQHPELELLRGSSGESSRSQSQYASMRPSEEG